MSLKKKREKKDYRLNEKTFRDRSSGFVVKLKCLCKEFKDNSNMLVLEETFEGKLLVHTIFLDALNGMFKSISTNSNGKTELQMAKMSCAMLGSFPF